MDDNLFRQVKALAARTGGTFTQIIEDAVRQFLAGRRPGRVREPASLPTFRGGGLRPGVDLDNTAALLDVMDEDRAAD